MGTAKPVDIGEHVELRATISTSYAVDGLSEDAALEVRGWLEQLVRTTIETQRKLIAKYPDVKLGYSDCPGGILNAYVCGVLSFDEAVAELQKRTKAETWAPQMLGLLKEYAVLRVDDSEFGLQMLDPSDYFAAYYMAKALILKAGGRLDDDKPTGT
jgi:hypothetical protein